MPSSPLVRIVICLLAVSFSSFLSAEEDSSSSGLRNVFEQYDADRGNLNRFYNIPLCTADRKRREEFYQQWAAKLDEMKFERLDRDAQVDYLLFKSELQRTQRQAAEEAERDAEVLPLLPFGEPIVTLLEARRMLDPLQGKETASQLADIERKVNTAREKLARSNDAAKSRWNEEQAKRAAGRARDLSVGLGRWFDFYNGYDPVFTWWVKKPTEEVRKALEEYATSISDSLIEKPAKKASDPDRLVGHPIGAEALTQELNREWIPYTPAELVEIARREFAWCDREMDKAARELGFGDDWRKAQEHVKSLHVEPGEQPKLIKELALEAERFLDDRKLVTVPPLCRETWRVEMMSAGRQRVNPYFTGGEVISVSFPTDEMTHTDKLMSMRGNNIHFARATVHHELIPGHHLQNYMTKRHRPYRARFQTPFWLEGWAVYWEMKLWDLGFAKSPENRIGLLFWRKHRCARIIFTLAYHLESMSAEEAVDFLVERVGHEPRNATAEVRRSIGTGYSPLYQCAYMLGALQFRALHRSLVEGGEMTECQFHDIVLRHNSLPIELLRALLDEDVELTRNHVPHWRFADEGASR